MGEKLCPVCESPNPTSAKHCDLCGERLVVGAGPSMAVVGDEPGVAGGSLDEELAHSALLAAQVAAPAEPDLSELAAFDRLLAGEEAGGNGGFSREAERTIVDNSPPSFEDLRGYGSASEARLDRIEATFAAEEAAGLVADDDLAEATPADAMPALDDFGASVTVAKVSVYVRRQPVHSHEIVHDETLIGRYDPVSNAYPELDLTPYDADRVVSRKHAYIYREGGAYFLCPVSGGGTQHNKRLLNLGEKVKLIDGDAIIIGGAIALRFELG